MKINKLLLFISVILLLNTVGCVNNKNSEISFENEEYSLVSTEERLVFKKEDNYQVFYINENITKIEIVKAFSNNLYANQYYVSQNQLEYKDINCIDNLVIFEMNDEYLKDYEGMFKNDIIFSMVSTGFEYIEET